MILSKTFMKSEHYSIEILLFAYHITINFAKFIFKSLDDLFQYEYEMHSERLYYPKFEEREMYNDTLAEMLMIILKCI